MILGGGGAVGCLPRRDFIYYPRHKMLFANRGFVYQINVAEENTKYGRGPRYKREPIYKEFFKKTLITVNTCK